MAFASDTFTDAAATALDSHSPEVGGPITKHPNYAANAVISNENRARAASGSGDRLYYYGGSPGSADYDVGGNLHVKTNQAGAGAGLAGRVDTGADTYYQLHYDQASGAWLLDKVVAGSRTNLGSFSQSLSTATTYALKLEMRGSALKAYIAAVERISVTDSAITAAGKAAVSFRGAGSNTASYHIDDLVCDDAPAGGSAVPAIMDSYRRRRS
jgi:hypothetical protein